MCSPMVEGAENSNLTKWDEALTNRHEPEHLIVEQHGVPIYNDTTGIHVLEHTERQEADRDVLIVHLGREMGVSQCERLQTVDGHRRPQKV